MWDCSPHRRWSRSQTTSSGPVSAAPTASAAAPPAEVVVSRHDIAGIWVAFFQECQQQSCEQDKWREQYYWIDWSSINQDDAAVRERQILAIPIYMRCCNSFVAIENDYTTPVSLATHHPARA